MTPHPARTPATRRILDAIGAGNPSPPMSRITRKALLATGLIYQLGDKVLPSALGPIRVAQFEMPVAVHMQWCAHCSDVVAANPAAVECVP